MSSVHLYVQLGLTDNKLQYVERSAVSWLKVLHQNQQLVPKDTDIQTYKKAYTPILFASGFGALNDPHFPKPAPNQPVYRDASARAEKFKTPTYTQLLRDYLAIDLDFTDQKDYRALKQKLQTDFKHVTWAFYPSISFPDAPHCHLIIELNNLVDEPQYMYLLKSLFKQLDLDLKANDQSNFVMAHAINGPLYRSKLAHDEAIFNDGPQTTPLDTLAALANYQAPPQRKKVIPLNQVATKPINQFKIDPATIKPFKLDDQVFRRSVENFAKQPATQTRLANYDKFWRFTEGIAAGILRQQITQAQGEFVMDVVANDNAKWTTNNQLELKTELKKLENGPDQLDKTPGIQHYLPLIDPTIVSLRQYFLRYKLSPGFEPNPKMPIYQACEIISQHFNFAIAPSHDPNDMNDVVMYNPLVGAWEHDENNFSGLLGAIRPNINNNDYQIALRTWGNDARGLGKFIHPYNGTRYTLWQNGVLDIITNELIPLSDPLVESLMFTKRNLHHCDFVFDAPNPEFPHDRVDGGTWSPQSFIEGYTHPDDPDHSTIRDYFLFGFALGLFSGHNSGVHFDIRGQSRWGKSTLAEIFGTIYDGRIAITPYNQLNQPFPLTSYNLDTGVIWINESNTDTAPLNNEYGIPFYDGAADPQLRLSVKHKGSLIIDDPPQMFIDGTQFIQANEINTGPAGRTLAYDLPLMTKEIRNQVYSKSINTRLRDPKVIEYLVFQMISAFQRIVPAERRENFVMNLANQHDVDLLPPIASKWREQLVNANQKVNAWAEEYILPFIIPDKPLHMWLLYELYLEYIRQSSPDGKDTYAFRLEKFSESMLRIFKLHDLTVDYGKKNEPDLDGTKKRRREIKSLDTIGFNLKQFEEITIVPATLKNPASPLPKLFTKKVLGWFELRKDPTTQTPDPKSPTSMNKEV